MNSTLKTPCVKFNLQSQLIFPFLQTRLQIVFQYCLFLFKVSKFLRSIFQCFSINLINFHFVELIIFIIVTSNLLLLILFKLHWKLIQHFLIIICLIIPIINFNFTVTLVLMILILLLKD